AKKYDRSYWLTCSREGRFTEELWQELAEGGYLGMMIPEQYGGAGLGMREMGVLLEEIGNQGIPLLLLVVSNVMDAILIAKHGTEAQKKRYLPALAGGGEKGCFAITEPTAGSNSFRIETLARLDGDSYVIKGQKTFITGVNQSDYILLVTRTTPFDDVEDKQEGLSLFIVDRRSPGLELQEQDTRILHPEKQFAIFLDNVRVPRENLLGKEGMGTRYLFDALNPERISGAAVAVGLGRFVLQKAVAYAKERVVFDVPIGAHQGLQHPMAIAKIHLELAALMARHAASLFDRGENAGPRANMAKFAAAEAAIEACDLAIEVHGGSGFTGDMDIITLWPLIRLLRTAPVSREMILNYVGEHVLGLPRSY
ncbi:MAG: acyl-CoA dehydrogenase family protein, partial [Dehalococcoidia bacterium]